MNEIFLAADAAARAIALTALDRTLLVEAGAGSGKTSVLAGRVTSLLAAGRSPRDIAAVTFTELAAGELRERIARFVAEVAEGLVRPDLHAAFPKGPTVAQRAALSAARTALDELTCTTIHGFCQRLLTPYPVEAAMDPGATVMDASAAFELFDEIVSQWLRKRLSGARQSQDLLAELYIARPQETQTLLKLIAERMLRHRGAQVPSVETKADVLRELRQAIRAFRNFLASLDCEELGTTAMVDGLEDLLRNVPAFAHETSMLLHLLDLEVPEACATGNGAFASYRRKGKWSAALKANKSTLQAAMINDQAVDCYQACRDAHDAVRSYAASRVLTLLATELAEVLALFGKAKRDAALIDFDDLILKARDLLEFQPSVRAALSRRFSAILIDEFQDTDRLQCEILWRLCAENPDASTPWTNCRLRPGSLFLVGDPKQAIYRFRGADVRSYFSARDRLTLGDETARVSITQNFRSVDAILTWVNDRFEAPLSVAGQSGFEALFSLTAAGRDQAAVATLPVDVAGSGASALRDAEAEAVALCCGRLVGNLMVRSREGMRACRPDDIALLAPTGTELWRYERALEARGISVSTQAGKGFYRRQEIQDLIALTRTIADSRDTLAFGALMRGPLVGLTEEELLDAVGGLPEVDDAPGRLFLWTPADQVAHPVLRPVLQLLQALAKQAHAATPFVLLCQAVEEMQVRPLLRQRLGRTAERALANVDQFLESARAYDMSGLQSFAVAMRAQWQDAQRTIEARPDTEERSVSLVTMHSSKGLEWPVVIPVNTGGTYRAMVDAAVDGEGRLHLSVFGLHGPAGAAAIQAEKEELEREMHRLWYVAATRARDLLLLPNPSSGVPGNSWMGRFPMRLDELPPIDLDAFEDAPPLQALDQANEQDRPLFVAEADGILARSAKILRVTPHLAEAGESVGGSPLAMPLGSEDADIQAPPPRGSLARGLILHKLLEEVLTGETSEDVSALTARAAALAVELPDAPGVMTFDPSEAAQSVLRGLGLPNIQAVRERLVAECSIASSLQTDGSEEITLGVADAVVPGPSGGIELIIDWKSDVDPSPAAISHYRAQVSAYLKATRAPQGLIVFLTRGVVERVDRR